MELLYALPLLVKAFILGIVEGLTEFLPISSTGHLILAGSLLGWTDQKAKLFDVAIQTGAMFAIIWYYRARIGATLAGMFSDPTAKRFAINVLIAFLPAAIIGVFFASRIKTHLFKPVPVALAFIVGGLIIFWVEHRHRIQRIRPRVFELDDLTPSDAIKLGVAQAFSLIPGTSRSGATIIGGMLFGLSRKTATEFSFFLAIPDPDRRRRLRHLQVPLDPLGRRHPAVCRRAHHGLLQRARLRALADPLRCQPQLRGLCLVPDRLRRDRAAHRRHRRGRLVRLTAQRIAWPRAWRRCRRSPAVRGACPTRRPRRPPSPRCGRPTARWRDDAR